MNKITFLFGVHNHQPVGNFESVIERIFLQCYKPFLQILERYPKVRISLHFTGPLYEWIDKKENGTKELIKEMVLRGQIELMGGGFYEPILSAIPEEDGCGQIRMLSDYIADNYKSQVNGMWLAERVWEPSLPKILNRCNIKYTLLDDTHFYYAGLNANDMFGYYVTEKEGHSLSLFPIDKNLRYSVPFVKADKIISYLKDISNKFPGTGITYGDDGEKFGEWPGTNEWVYKNGWLCEFFGLLSDNSDWIEMKTFTEYLNESDPKGRIYLPTSSYEEMGEWVLPPSSALNYEEFIHYLKQNNIYEKYKPFVRGGIWSNFFSKYDEINNMHKKMLYVSRKIKRDGITYEKESMSKILKSLYRGQCNCAYWHGLFGGFYLPHLRSAIYQNLINAEQTEKEYLAHIESNKNKVSIEDIDCDNNKEVVLEGDELNAYVKPSYGGALYELDLIKSNFNLLNTLKRREESYHKKIFEIQREDIKKEHNNEIKTIHDLVVSKEKDLDKKIFYDWHNKYSFLDHFLDSKTTFDLFKTAKYKDLGNFVSEKYNIIDTTADKNSVILRLGRDGNISINKENYLVSITKKYTIRDNIMVAEYKLSKIPTIGDVYFGIELNINPETDISPSRYIMVNEKKISFQSDICEQNIGKIEIHCDDLKFNIGLSSQIPFELWSYPIKAVSQSESGFELTYQGTTLLFKWNLEEIRDGVELKLRYNSA